MNTLIQGYMRAAQVWLCISLQSPLQLDTQMRQTVLSLGSYLIGQATTMDSARVLSDAMFLRSPWRTKHYRTVNRYVPPWELWSGKEIIFPQEPVFMPLDEQREVGARLIRSLRNTPSCCDQQSVKARSAPRCFLLISAPLIPGNFPMKNCSNHCGEVWQPDQAYRLPT